ncbi:MAG: hypothetical protein LKI80_03650 [Sporolactobacillus sp.]|jgi:hypothetical protein|nr:hypothetical protein [Sporolactobacillus sp.]
MDGKEERVMLDFHHSWPYERVADDIYFEECPFCHALPVLIPIKQKAIQAAYEGIKTRIIMPCCHGKIIVEHMDNDYVWALEALR